MSEVQAKPCCAEEGEGRVRDELAGVPASCGARNELGHRQPLAPCTQECADEGDTTLRSDRDSLEEDLTGTVEEEEQMEKKGEGREEGQEEKDEVGEDEEVEEEEEGRREEEEDISDTTEDEEEVDPRVAENLEIMNQSCAEVNRLENELDEARSKYRSTFQTSSQRMEELGAKIKKNIQRARHYFEVSDRAKQAQNEALRAARLFQTANGNYRAAIEMVTLAEKGLQDDVSAKAKTLTSAWQETLSHAVEKLTEAEREKTRTESEHNNMAAICAKLEGQIHGLEKKYKRSIAKARPYFETKAELELKLQQLKQNVWDLQQAIGIQKARYSEALRCLETVSTEIHESRRSRKKLLLQYPREPGVGAETDSVRSSISDHNTIERGVFSTYSALFPDEEDEEESDSEAGDVFSSHSGSCSDLRKQTLVRSLSRRSVTRSQQQWEERREAEDSTSASSQESGSVFSRSISGTSMLSSDGDSSAPGSPTSLSIVVHAQSFSGERVTIFQKPGITLASPVDMTCGDIGGSRQPHSIGRECNSGDECRGGNRRADQEDDTEVQSFGAGDPTERGSGDGSSQEDSPKESSLLLTDPQPPPSVCSWMSSGFSASSAQSGVSQQAPVESAATQVNATGLRMKTTPVTSAPPTPQGTKGEAVKAPLRRTDGVAHRPLQGVMLLNPSDLPSSSLHRAGPMY